MHNTIEYSKSYKASREFNEIRDVPESHYVCQWWIQQFDQIKVEKSSNTFIQFKKKHRDHIRWNDALLPFRRSGLWMTIKVVFHTILIKRLGHVGTIAYKLLITHFLTHIINKRHVSSTSTDLLVHCIRKILRRLNKIESLLSSIESNHMMEWFRYMKHEIQMKVDEVLPKPNLLNFIQMNEHWSQPLSLNTIKFNDPEIYQYSCLQLKAYLNNNNSNETCELFSGFRYNGIRTNFNDEDYIPSYNILIKQMNYTIATCLTYIEIWVEFRLEQWINRPSLIINAKNRFEILLNFFDDYQKEALNYYWLKDSATDPIGYSRFILTSLTIICCIHKKLCQDKRFERLQFHSLHIPNILELFEFLVLPNREDMIRAHNLYIYFTEFNNRLYPDLLSNIESNNAFGVYFAYHSPQMNDAIQRIRIEAEQDKQNKIKEVNNAKEKYKQLMNVVHNTSCDYTNNRHKMKRCQRCKTLKEANQIKVKVYECPMPLAHESALAVIFELQMPIEIRCYRDIIWQFTNRSNSHLENCMYEWLNVPSHGSKLKSFCTGFNNHKVRLVSSTKSISQTHYSTPPSIAHTSIEGFLFENSLKIQISPTKPIGFEDEVRILTPQLNHPDYKQLQFTVSTTQFVQNDVIAQLSNYSTRLKPSQIIEFGSFRSGHRLQWWNLLTILEMDSLSFAEESVAILIIHSILQYGPLISESKTFSESWCPESHQQLLEDHFVNELIVRLNHHLDDCQLNWQNELVLVVITMRILSICNTNMENKTVNLILKCRKIGEKSQVEKYRPVPAGKHRK
ncbi:unnamed protein product [Rotaria sp. Silwood1]|nr:unnamed protein product [Rotaria sp. Silwood1]CAF1613804.1 unnamed protein product [Rotaria sp. Silwood1]